MIDEEQTYREFEELLEEAITYYGIVKNISYPALEVFIGDKVWASTIKYHRMMMTTKEKFFESLYDKVPVGDYSKGIKELWGNIDHTYIDRSIEELQKMVIQRDFRNAEMYGNKEITQRSIKLEHSRRDYVPKDYELYKLNPEKDFRIIERRYMNRHIKLYENMLKRYSKSKNIESELVKLMKRYDKLDKTIPYFYKDGRLKCYNTIATYNSMLYNVNLTRSAWNRAIYDAKLLDNHLWYLPAHPFACPDCASYQGRVYTDDRTDKRYPLKETAIEGGVGHPNCKHVWVSYWSDEQIQKEKYNSPEWEEKYKTKQKLQSLDLEKSRLLTDRRIYKSLEQQDLVDKTSARIKNIREKKRELEAQM